LLPRRLQIPAFCIAKLCAGRYAAEACSFPQLEIGEKADDNKLIPCLGLCPNLAPNAERFYQMAAAKFHNHPAFLSRPPNAPKLRSLLSTVPRPVVVVHQPHFFPWLGYYNKLVNADLFILQDDVQFRRRYYQNRTLIRSPQRAVQWLTIPIRARRTTLIKDVVVDTPRWAETARRSLRHSYASAPFFAQFWDPISASLNPRHKYLVDINESTLALTLQLLEVGPIMSRISSLRISGIDPTDNIIDACHIVGGRSYIFGEGGGRIRHSASRIEEAGINTYQQRFRGAFSSALEGMSVTADNVSIVEFLFEHGADYTRRLIQRSWRVGEDL
jgi:hypothetical protein